MLKNIVNIVCTYVCPSPVQSAVSPLPPPQMDASSPAALWLLSSVSWWLWAPLASLWVLVLWVFWWVSEVLAFWWALGLSASWLWLPSLLLSLPWLQRGKHLVSCVQQERESTACEAAVKQFIVGL